MSNIDLEELIAQSKERLGKHKEYLERTAERASGSSGNVAADAPNISPSRGYTPSRFNTTSPPKHASSSSRPSQQNNSNVARPSNQYQQQQNRTPSYQQQQAPQQYTSPTNNQQGGGGNYNPYGSAIGRAGYNNYGDPSEQDLYPNSPSSGRDSKKNRTGYYISGRTPTKVYDRGQAFVEKRENFLEKQRMESWEKEMQTCTFSPFVSKKGAAAQGRTQTSAANQSSSSIRRGSTSPNSPQHQHQQQQNEQQQMNEQDKKDFLEWCVASDKSNVGFHVDAPSVFLHIQRQADARRAKQEGEAKLSMDVANWKPRLTVPQEFNFGRTDVPIKSLRKPMLQMVRLDSSRDTILGSNRGTSGSRSPSNKRQSKSPQQRRKEQEEKEQNEMDAAEAVQQVKVAELTSVSKHQKQQISEQSGEIAKLNGMLESMKRESEAAKAKVREMTLAATMVDGGSK